MSNSPIIMLTEKPFHEASHQELACEFSTQELRLFKGLLLEMSRAEFVETSKEILLYVMCDTGYSNLPQEVREYLVIMFQFFDSLYLAERHAIRI